ncbi:MutS-related protein [Flavobacterium sp. P21]|uniref:MutS-related protein n=1 Tax=Flavobacterium sp. P21 TaxID=3423948 RepID=UPI003D670C22
MNNIQDLNIKEEVLPIFDSSLNSFTRKKILHLLETPLPTQAHANERQNILKGFIHNKEVLKSYSYTVLYLNEVHYFLNNFKEEELNWKRFLFFGPTADEILTHNKIHQMILFFHRLESVCFSRLNLIHFPKSYRKDLNRILSFLSFFELKKFEHIIREKQLKTKHVKNMLAKISVLKEEGRIECFWEDLFLFESYLSISKTIIDREFVFPLLTEKGLVINDFYHPLVENPVKNSFRAINNVILLNGPNMSGKSTFLKSVSLCVYLGNLGFGIPASRRGNPILH